MPKTTKPLSAEMIEQIKNYGSKITTLEDFITAVRQTPDVYIGPIDSEGYITLIREIFQNAIDEILRSQWGESPANAAIVSFDERTYDFIVEDNGRGLPHDEIERIIMSDHTSSNYKKQPYQYTSGKNGMGIGIVNALSSYFKVISAVLGEVHEMEFVEGYPVSPEHKTKYKKDQGTIIQFRPSISLCTNQDWKNLSVNWKDIYTLIADIVPTTPIGTRVLFNAIDSEGKSHQMDIINEDGILSHLINITTKPMLAPIPIKVDTGEMMANIIFTWDSDSDSESDAIIKSFNNYCPTLSTKESMHVAGFTDGLCSFFKKFMNNVYLANTKSKTVVVNDDILGWLRAVVSTAMLEPKYHGQSKNILANPNMKPFVSKAVQDGLDEWAKLNPKDLQKLCKFFKDMADARSKLDTAKISIKKQYKANVYNQLPEMYVAPTGNKGLEMIIVEGKSAKQGCVDARDRTRQGILPIRGKFPNVYGGKCNEADILQNNEAAAIITVLDGGEGTNVEAKGRHFNIDKCIYDKVIIMTDADEDGIGHIRPLLLKFFLRFMPGLVLNGRLYSAAPPLYGGCIGRGKNMKRIYFSNDLELAKYLQREFAKANELTDIKGKKLSPTAVSSLILRNIKYDNMLYNASESFKLEPHLLEIILNHYEEGYKGIKKAIESRYRFIKVTKEHGLTVVRGPLDDKVRTIPVDDRLISICMPVVNLIKQSEQYYNLNGKTVSLYDVIRTFNSYKPKDIQRYKGLGEMNAEQLKYAVVHPDYDRVLLRYTIDDIKQEIKEIRAIESDFSILLRDIRKPDVLSQ